MAADQSFVRGAPQRSSHNNVLHSHTTGVEYIRQRALQAADLYHNTVVGQGDTGGVVKSVPSGNSPLVETASHTNYSNPYHSHAAEPVPETSSGKPPEAAVPSGGTDAYYKQKLRSGFIDLRNSYSEKRKPRSSHSRTGANNNTMALKKPAKGDSHHEIKPYAARNLTERRGLYRSNSSLEIDSLDYGTSDAAPIRRDYGSASSLDIIGAGGGGDEFFQLLHDYRNEKSDQRAAAPPKVQDLLKPRSPTERSNSMKTSQQTQLELPNVKISNGSVPQTEEQDPSSSPRLKQKKNKDRKHRNKSLVGGDGGGLLKKLRGGKSEEVDGGVKSEEGELEERQRKKAFVHLDCQSIGVNFAAMIKQRHESDTALQRNTTTGASAASGMWSVQKGGSDAQNETTDYGDGKSNDLVYSCPFFRNELGGEEERTVSINKATTSKKLQQLLGNNQSGVDTALPLMRRPACNGVAVLDQSVGHHGASLPIIVTHRGLVLEYVDHGALYYRKYFYDTEHWNLFGLEDSLGPIAISLKRERVEETMPKSADKSVPPATMHEYRMIVRTRELSSLRGSIPEDCIPLSGRSNASRGLPPKDVLEFVLPGLNLSCLRYANTESKTTEQLLKLDEQGVSQHYKFGVMLCRSGQSSEEEMYNNEHGSGMFNDFLSCIGRRVKLQGFEKYRGGLDCKTNSTGTHSYYTEFVDYEVMCHVSTLLPYTANNRQQLLRKRHIGNDIVTIVFQEPGSLPFTPKSVRSHFQHVFIIVRAHVTTDNNSVKYSIAVSRSKEVPPFGPPLPDGAVFSRGPEFADYLLTKAINAENAVHKSLKFVTMATRTREQYLKDLANNHVTSTTLDSGSKISKFSLTSGKKKEKPRTRPIPDSYARGAIVWSVQVEDFSQGEQMECLLAIAMETLVVMEEESKDIVFYCPTKAIIGWTSQNNSLCMYYDRGECIVLKTLLNDPEEVQEIVNRLYVVSHGCETVEMALRRNPGGQLGFHVQYEGIISDVETYGYAWQTGLRSGCRLVEVCKVATATLSHDQMVSLLRTSSQVKVVMIPAFPDGNPRRGFDELRSSHSAFLGQYTSPAAEVTLDHSSDSNSSRSTVRGTGNRSATDPRYLSPQSTMSSTYGDFRSLNNYLDNKPSSSYSPRDQALLPSHQYTSSHDSTGSKSSGTGGYIVARMTTSNGGPLLLGPIPSGRLKILGDIGHGSEHPEPVHSRQDNLSSEGFVSGGDSLERDRQGDQPQTQQEGWNSGQWKIYPAYKDSHTQLSTQTGPLSPSASAQDPTYWSHVTMNHVTTSNSMDFLSTKPGGAKPGQAPIPSSKTRSFSNLAPRPYINPKETRQQQAGGGTYVSVGDISGWRQREDVPAKDNKENMNKSLRFESSHPESEFASKSSQLSSTLAEEGRHRAMGQRKASAPTKVSSNVLQDLKRLILNPDDSFSEDHMDKGLIHYPRSPRPRRLLRTLSDESMCGTVSFPQRPLGAEGSDVLFTGTAGTSHVAAANMQDSENRSDPQRLYQGKRHNKSSPNIPLPDSESSLDWNVLVDTASKALSGSGKVAGTSSSSQDLSTDARRTGSEVSDARRAGGDSVASPSLQGGGKSTGSWGRGDGSKSERIQALENRVSHLEKQVQQERDEKSGLEDEVSRLRRENKKLQEESQTAAAQLRKFTEWFFQNIDRQ